MSYFLRGAAVLLILSACFLALLFFMQDKLILYPTPSDGSASPGRPGWGDAWIDEGQFFGKSYEPDGPVRGTVLVYHGNAGTVDHREALAKAVAERGFRVVLVEYPGYGERGGTASLHSVLTGSVDAFVRARRTWSGPLYLIGESLGAGIAAQVAARHRQEVAGVLLFTPWDSLYKLANAKFGGLPVGVVLRHKFDSSAALASFPGNVVIVAARQDTLIPASHARALAERLPQAGYIELPNAGHNTWFASLTESAWDRLLAALAAPDPSA